MATAYPDYRLGQVHLCHGHYLDAHLQGSLSNRLLRRVLRTIGGGRPQDSMTIEDYEAVMVPLAELLFTVAQMPGGTEDATRASRLLRALRPRPARARDRSAGSRAPPGLGVGAAAAGQAGDGARPLAHDDPSGSRRGDQGGHRRARRERAPPAGAAGLGRARDGGATRLRAGGAQPRLEPPGDVAGLRAHPPAARRGVRARVRGRCGSGTRGPGPSSRSSARWRPTGTTSRPPGRERR